jgi:hypothetical protein
MLLTYFGKSYVPKVASNRSLITKKEGDPILSM